MAPAVRMRWLGSTTHLPIPFRSQGVTMFASLSSNHRLAPLVLALVSACSDATTGGSTHPLTVSITTRAQGSLAYRSSADVVITVGASSLVISKAQLVARRPRAPARPKAVTTTAAPAPTAAPRSRRVPHSSTSHSTRRPRPPSAPASRRAPTALSRCASVPCRAATAARRHSWPRIRNFRTSVCASREHITARRSCSRVPWMRASSRHSRRL